MQELLRNKIDFNVIIKVLDPKPMPGMVIKPSCGLAVLNGLTPLKVEMTPREVLKFDARVLIQIRGGKQLELRLSGESEEPAIDIDIVSLIKCSNVEIFELRDKKKFSLSLFLYLSLFLTLEAYILEL